MFYRISVCGRILILHGFGHAILSCCWHLGPHIQRGLFLLSFCDNVVAYFLFSHFLFQ